MAKLKTTILFVKDLARMVAFYRDGLGLTPLPERASDGWAELDAGGVTLGLHLIPAEIAARIHVSYPPARRTGTPIKLAFAVDDLEAARARLAAQGALMSEPTSWGSCDGADLEGNVFQIVKI
jgi:catechol 2,3-dioxygenase-like lactoylglutathione lyase family enzyme